MLHDHDEDVQGRQGHEWQPYQRWKQQNKKETTEGDGWREQVRRAVDTWQMKQERWKHTTGWHDEINLSIPITIVMLDMDAESKKHD